MTPILKKFESFYRDFSTQQLANIGDIYEDDIVFIDPVHEVQGIEALKSYFMSSLSGVESCHFTLEQISETEDGAHIAWTMHYQHSRLKKGESLRLDGISALSFHKGLTPEDTRISWQHDYYDLGQMVYEHVPIVGHWIRKLKARLTGAKAS